MNGERKQKDSRLFGGAAKFGSKMYLLALFGLLVLSLLWFAPQKAFTLATAGNGPGGVGVTDGSSTLELWLRADRGVFSDSGCTTAANNTDNVGCWKDQSGNNANATQSVIGKQPTFNTASLNNQPLLYFNGSQVDVLVTGQILLNQFTIFSVFNSSEDGFVYEQGPDTGTSDGSNLYSGTACTSYVSRGITNSGLSLLNTPRWSASTNIVTHSYGGSHLTHLLNLNDALPAQSGCGSANNVSSSDVTNSIYIGARSGLTYPLTGNVAELIFFNENLPAVQKILVENYLSAKYNIPLASNDYYDGDTPANGDFDLDVAGIGRFGGVSHTEAQAAGMVVVNGTFLNADGDWLLFGHNVATNVNTTNDIPAGWNINTSQRWLRSFYFDRTDALPAGGTVDVIFDFSDGGMTGNPAGTATNYRLLTRAGATGTFAEIAGACVTGGTSIAGDRVTFSGVDVTCLGSNFTLGTIDVVNSPTAVSLQPIVATPQTNGLFIFAACVLALGLGSLWACLRHRPE